MGAMAFLVMVSAMAFLVIVSAMALLVMPLLRSTPTRSPPTSTSMPLLTTTLDPALTLPRLTTALLPGRVTTLSACLTAASSTSTTEPTMPKATLPRSHMTARLPTPLLSLVSDMASPTVVSSAMALLTVVSSVMVWWATVSEFPTEDFPTSAKPSFKDFQETRDTTQVDRQRKHTDKILDNIFSIFIYLLINM